METLVLSDLLRQNPENLAGENEQIYDASLKATKYLFDKALESEQRALLVINSLLKDINPVHARQTRSKAKKSEKSAKDSLEVAPTPLSSLYTDGMEQEQIWNQLELKNQGLCNVLKFMFRPSPVEDEALQLASGDEPSELDEEFGWDSDDSDDEDDEDDEDEDEDEGDEDEDVGEEDGEDDEELDGEEGEEVDDDSNEPGEYADENTPPVSERILLLNGSAHEEMENDELFLNLDRRKPKKPKSGKANRHPELDDGFFSLSEFNAETEETEARDSSRGKLASDSGSDDEVDDQSMDIFKNLEEQQGSSFGEDDLEDTDMAQAYYKDFFAPPQKGQGTKTLNTLQEIKPARQSKVKFHDEVRVKEIEAANRGRSAKDLRMQTLSSLWDQGEDEEDDEKERNEDGEESEDDVGDELGDNLDPGDKTILRKKRDTWEEDSGSSEDEADPQGRDTIDRFKDDLFGEEEDESQPMDQSTHQSRMAQLAEHIAKLEAENVGEKDWTLMGEATSRKRPHNSLLEEDLEFEQVQRPVATVTTEQIATLEEVIKKRILENNFDDVERKRFIDEKPLVPSRFFQLEDAKSKQSLSKLYEDEYTANQDGQRPNEKDVKLQKEHKELDQLWERISNKLDALCNAHFTPRQPKATISTISNVAAASLESSLPTSQALGTMMAPEEILAPSSNDPRDKSELSPGEKRAKRMKERKARAKSRQKLDAVVDKVRDKKRTNPKTKESKERMLKSVVKAGKGVRILGGSSNQRESKVTPGGGSLKL